MIIKRFQAKTEDEATAQAHKELGSMAVIMNVRTVKPKGFFAFFKPRVVEVTAAIEEAGECGGADKLNGILTDNSSSK